MSIDPIKATTAIKESYLNYLSTTFHMRDPVLCREFSKELSFPGRFIKGPILEVTPSFVEGSTLQDLIAKGILSESFKELESEYLPLDRPFYLHQEKAICKVIQEYRNIVVATGTGSGKTEIFLLPILNHLLREKEQQRLGPGVRALLLYPMNALANDQLVRLRRLLKNYSHITFGRYTGETEETQRAAESTYKKVFNKDPLPNELLSREQMRNNPPHILLTNYAMLEYLLLRPEDHVFFDGAHAGNWWFLVLDEAHSYSGAKGIEIAMLLRRLKDRVVKSVPHKLLCIATSATLGGGQADYPKLADFAKQLFGEEFSENDVIGAERKQLFNENKSWGKPNAELYLEWQKIIDENITDSTAPQKLINAGKKAVIPDHVLSRAISSRGKDRYFHLSF